MSLAVATGGHVDDGAQLNPHRVVVPDRDAATGDDPNASTARRFVAEREVWGSTPVLGAGRDGADLDVHRTGSAEVAHVVSVLRQLGFPGLAGLQHRHLDELSGGQRRRAPIATVLARGTRCVLLDEPSNDLDVRHAVQVVRLLRRSADELGRAVVLLVHDVDVATAWSDRVVAVRGPGGGVDTARPAA